MGVEDTLGRFEERFGALVDDIAEIKGIFSDVRAVQQAQTRLEERQAQTQRDVSGQREAFQKFKADEFKPMEKNVDRAIGARTVLVSLVLSFGGIMAGWAWTSRNDAQAERAKMQDLINEQKVENAVLKGRLDQIDADKAIKEGKP